MPAHTDSVYIMGTTGEEYERLRRRGNSIALEPANALARHTGHMAVDARPTCLVTGGTGRHAAGVRRSVIGARKHV